MKTAAILGLVSLAGIAGAAISVHHSAAQANDGLQCTLTRVTTTYGFGPMKIEKSEPFIWTFKFLPNDKAQLIAPSSDMTVEVPVKATATRYELFEKSETKDGDQSITYWPAIIDRLTGEYHGTTTYFWPHGGGALPDGTMGAGSENVEETGACRPVHIAPIL